MQRLGAGREKTGATGGGSSSLGLEPVDAHAGILFHARRGARVEKGQPLATLYASREEMLAEPLALLKQAITYSKAPPGAVALVSRIFNRETAENYLRNAVR